MTVTDLLLDAARANDPVAYELINGWSTSPGKQLGGNTVPGMWLMGTALALMRRTPPGVLHVDLMACHAWTGGLEAAKRVRAPVLVLRGARDLMAPPKSRAGADRHAREARPRHAARHRPRDDGRAARRRARRVARVPGGAMNAAGSRPAPAAPERVVEAARKCDASASTHRSAGSRRGFDDFRAHPLPSLFYGACFAVMAWLITIVFEHATPYVSALVSGFFLVGPFLATGFYALSRRRERGEPVWLAPTLDAWRPNVGAIGVFAPDPRGRAARLGARVARRVRALLHERDAERAGLPRAGAAARPTSSSCSPTPASAASSRCSCSRSARWRCR